MFCSEFCKQQKKNKNFKPKKMKLDTSTIVNVLVALLIFAVINQLFLEKAIEKLPSMFEE